LGQKISVLLLTLLLSISAYAAPAAVLWERWLAHDPSSTEQINHNIWQGWLNRYLSTAEDGITYIDYASVTAEDKQQLAAYIFDLGSLPISLYNRNQQRAYWINLYNALTIELIVKHYPVDSIRDIDISPGFFSNGPWQKPLLQVEGEPLSLDDIEHRILRPIWRDPRLHYAVNCASIGCPNLQAQAFTAENTERLLEQAAKAYINHPRGARIANGKLHVSSIYKWFREDFGDSEQGVIKHLRHYAEPPLDAQLQATTDIRSYHYDWDLNVVKK
jgi:hypothetical protein